MPPFSRRPTIKELGDHFRETPGVGDGVAEGFEDFGVRGGQEGFDQFEVEFDDGQWGPQIMDDHVGEVLAQAFEFPEFFQIFAQFVLLPAEFEMS